MTTHRATRTEREQYLQALGKDFLNSDAPICADVFLRSRAKTWDSMAGHPRVTRTPGLSAFLQLKDLERETVAVADAGTSQG